MGSDVAGSMEFPLLILSMDNWEALDKVRVGGGDDAGVLLRRRRAIEWSFACHFQSSPWLRSIETRVLRRGSSRRSGELQRKWQIMEGQSSLYAAALGSGKDLVFIIRIWKVCARKPALDFGANFCLSYSVLISVNRRQWRLRLDWWILMTRSSFEQALIEGLKGLDVSEIDGWSMLCMMLHWARRLKGN